MSPNDSILKLREKMAESIIGQEKLIERLILVLLANGNLLLEGLPVLAKTRAEFSLPRTCFLPM
jgi:MoxR-like ATPase